VILTYGSANLRTDGREYSNLNIDKYTLLIHFIAHISHRLVMGDVSDSERQSPDHKIKKIQQY
jgi:hypothetical protein